MTTVTWDKPMLEKFKKVYAKAVRSEAQEFSFQGQTYLVAYAKYMIEYLEVRLR
jgi:hypothetical protein